METFWTRHAIIIALLIPTLLMGADPLPDLPAIPPTPAAADRSAAPAKKAEKPASSGRGSEELPALPSLNDTGAKESGIKLLSPSISSWLNAPTPTSGLKLENTAYPLDPALGPLPQVSPDHGGMLLFPYPQKAEQIQYYPVSNFTFSYAPDAAKPNPKLPPINKLCAATKVKLTQGAGGYSAQKPGAKGGGIALAKLPANTGYSTDGLQAIFGAVVSSLNKSGIYGVLVIPDPAEMDSASGQDLRKASKDLHIQIYTSGVKTVRTIFKSGKGSEEVVNDKRHAWISKHSPLKSGSLLEKDKLQDYLSRLNRFPGRRVESAISSTGELGGVVLDYLVQEEKHITGYTQMSNAGTQSVGEWTARMGVIWRDPIPHDSLLNLEVSGATDLNSESMAASYQQPILLPNLLTARVYGSWGRFTASDVGLDTQNFKGTNKMAGTRFTLALCQWRGIPINLFTGIEWYDIWVSNETFDQTGECTFLLPNVGISTAFGTDRYAFTSEIMIEKNLPSVTGTDTTALSALGRFNPSTDFTIARGSAEWSFYLEPLLFGKKWFEGKEWRKATLAHEFAIIASGQYVFDNARPVPQFEQVVGGFSSVRGYPESIASGDDAMTGTLEYRLHIPRLLKPVDTIASEKAAKNGGMADQGVPKKSPFPFRPPTVGSSPYGRPDWDFIFRLFVDGGATFQNKPVSSLEADHTLAGAGAGVEVQIRRYLNIRFDWAAALLPVTISSVSHVHTGDNRYHVVVSLTW